MATTSKKTAAIKSALDMNIVAAAIELRKQVISASAQDILALANAKIAPAHKAVVQQDGVVVLRAVSSLDALTDAVALYGRTKARKLAELGITGADIIARVTVNVGGKLKTRSYMSAHITSGWNIKFVELIDKALLATLTDAEIRRYFPTHASATNKPIAKPIADKKPADKKPAAKKPAAKKPADKKPAAKKPAAKTQAPTTLPASTATEAK